MRIICSSDAVSDTLPRTCWLISTTRQIWADSIIISSILWVGKLRHRDVSQFTSSYTIRMWQLELEPRLNWLQSCVRINHCAVLPLLCLGLRDSRFPSFLRNTGRMCLWNTIIWNILFKGCLPQMACYLIPSSLTGLATLLTKHD